MEVERFNVRSIHHSVQMRCDLFSAIERRSSLPIVCRPSLRPTSSSCFIEDVWSSKARPSSASTASLLSLTLHFPGTHHELLEKNGVYAELYNTQFKAQAAVSGDSDWKAS